MYEGYLKLGFIQRIHGVNGQVMAWIDLPLDHIDQVKTIFIETGHTLVPYQVTHWQILSDQAIITFQGIQDRTQAYNLKGKILFVRTVDVPEQVLETDPMLVLVGYQVFDQHKKDLGKVARIEELPGQTMLIVEYLNKELMIPVHENLVKQIDHARKLVLVQLPLGFIKAVIG